jgi:hypothetical protein
MGKKLFVWGAIVFLIFFIAFRPDSAVDVFRSIGDGVMGMFDGFRDFFTGLVE